MTQASSAQPAHSQLAWKPARKPLTLAQRRAAFTAQMRSMALSDLEQVSQRLKALADELDHATARRWKQYERAAEMKIPPRTFQSWENGEVENSDGTGYDKMARFYTRKLGRKITREWIVFGDRPAPAETPDPFGEMTAEDDVDDLRTIVLDMRDELRALAAEVRRLSPQADDEQSGS